MRNLNNKESKKIFEKETREHQMIEQEELEQLQVNQDSESQDSESEEVEDTTQQQSRSNTLIGNGSIVEGNVYYTSIGIVNELYTEDSQSLQHVRTMVNENVITSDDEQNNLLQQNSSRKQLTLNNSKMLAKKIYADGDLNIVSYTNHPNDDFPLSVFAKNVQVTGNINITQIGTINHYSHHIAIDNQQKIQHHHQEKKKRPRKLIFNLPRENKQFSNRTKFLTKLSTLFESHDKYSFLIEGIGGIGKTQVALAYVYQNADHYDLIAWFSTHISMYKQYKQLACELKIELPDELNEHQLITLVHEQLVKYHSVLFTFDDLINQDDFQRYRLTENTPVCHYLITSRIPITITDKTRELEGFDFSEAEDFVKSQLDMEAKPNDLKFLVENIPRSPLVLSQTIAYLKNYQCSVNEYVSKLLQFRHDSSCFTSNLKFLEQSLLYTLTTFYEKFPNAHTFMRCAYVHHQNIPAELLCDNEVSLDRVQGTLLPELVALSLIQIGEENIDFCIHSILQTVLLNIIEKKLIVFDRTHESYLLEIINQFELVEQISENNNTLRQVSFPRNAEIIVEDLSFNWFDLSDENKLHFFSNHILKVLDHIDSVTSLPLYQRLIPLLESTAEKAIKYKLYALALTLFEKLYVILTNIDRTPSLLKIANCVTKIGETQLTLGYYSKALKNFNNAYILFLKFYSTTSSDHCKTEPSSTLNPSSQTLVLTDLFEEGYPDIAACLNNIAMAYQSNDQYEQALAFHKQALNLKQIIYQDSSPDILLTLNNIGAILDSKDTPEAALKHHLNTLEVLKKVYGENHPDAALMLNNIGMLYHKLGKSSNALAHLDESLRIQKLVYSDENKNIAACHDNIATVYSALKNEEQALTHYQQALDIWESLDGEDHLDFARTLYNIAHTYDKLERKEDALVHYKRALEIQKKVYQAGHPIIIENTIKIGELSSALNHLDDAKTFLDRTLTLCQESVSRNRSVMIRSLESLSKISTRMECPSDADEYRRRLFTLQRNSQDYSEQSSTDQPETTFSTGTVSFECHTESSYIVYGREITQRSAVPIGDGSFAIVYKALYRGTQAVAIKEFRKTQTLKQYHCQFSRELTVLKSISHPNVVKFIGVLEMNKSIHSLVMECIDGGTIHDFIFTDPNNKDWQLKIKIIIGIGYGLAALHENKIIHRDLYINNVLLTSEYEPKLCDFGLSQILFTSNTDDIMSSSTLQHRNPRYMPPEFISKDLETYSESTDIYSYGLIIWQLAALTMPFSDIPDNKAWEIYNKHKAEERNPIPADCPYYVTSVIEKAWAPYPTTRPPAKDIVSELENPGSSSTRLEMPNDLDF